MKLLNQLYMIMKVYFYLNENISMKKYGMGKEKNITKIEFYYLIENI